MHKKFAAWVLAQSWRAPVLTVTFGVLSLFGFLPGTIAAGALPVLMLLQANPAAGLRAANAGTLSVGVLVLLLSKSPWAALATVSTLFWLPLALALLLRRSGSLRFCFQVAVLVAGICLALVYAALDDPLGRWAAAIRPTLEVVAQTLQQAGVDIGDQALSRMQEATNWGTYATMLLLTVLAALFLGRWWQSLVVAPGGFGFEYRQLCLGRVLGAAALMVVTTSLGLAFFDFKIAVIDAWFWISIAALAFQGLAAMHEYKARGVLASGWLTALYVLLIVPVALTMMVAVFALVACGIADNWRRFRTHEA